MRKAGRVLLLFVLSLLSTAVLGVLTAVMSAVSLAATALIVPGTGDPNPDPNSLYISHTQRYLNPFSECGDAPCDLQPVPYSASFFPLVIFPGWCDPGRCDTWNASVQTGVDGLHTALLDPNLGPGEAVVFGYSQGGAVVSNELRAIADNPALLEKISSIVLIGNAYNPDGGLFTRLGFLPMIPFLDITFGPATPTDTGIPMTGIGFEYDPVMYAPLFWGNPLTMFNAFAAFDNVHGYYLTPDMAGSTDSIAYGYTDAELEAILATDCPGPHCRVDDEGNEYYMIPAKSLPMMNLIMSAVPGPLKPLVQPIVDLTSPVAKVLIDLGYDWSGDPGTTRYLSILPFSPTTNWLQVGADLVKAVGEGIENVFGGGSTVMIAPAEQGDVSPFSARVAGTTSVREDEDAVDVTDAEAVESTTQETADSTKELEKTAVESEETTVDKTASDPADAAKAERAAAKAEREAAREAAKAERAAKKAEREAAQEAAKATAASDDDSDTSEAAA